MVSYQKWTAIGFEVAKNQGMDTSQEESQNLISVLAQVWNSRRTELNVATVAEARSIAREEISVR